MPSTKPTPNKSAAARVLGIDRRTYGRILDGKPIKASTLRRAQERAELAQLREQLRRTAAAAGAPKPESEA